VGSLTYAGYLFGNIPWVKDNLAWIVLGIVIVTLMPMTIEFIRNRLARRAADGERQP
jgi:membrane-associated protein